MVYDQVVEYKRQVFGFDGFYFVACSALIRPGVFLVLDEIFYIFYF